MKVVIQETALDSNNFSTVDLPLSFFFDLFPFIDTRWASAWEDCSISIPMIPREKRRVLFASLYHYSPKVPQRPFSLGP